MKKFLLALIPFVLVVAMMSAFAIGASAAGNVVYISANGTGDGSSPDSPLGNTTGYTPGISTADPVDANAKMNAFYKAFDALKATGGTVVIVGEVKIDCSSAKHAQPFELVLPTGTETITITSKYNNVDYAATKGAKLVFDAETCNNTGLYLGMPTVWENLKIESILHDGTAYDIGGTIQPESGWTSDANQYTFLIACNGHKTVFGEGIEVTAKANSIDNTVGYPTILGGGRNVRVASTDVTIKSGTWNVICGGFGQNKNNDNQPAPVTGDANVTIEGGTIEKLYGCGNDYPNRQVAKIEGALNVTVTGGTVKKAVGDKTGENGGEYGTFKYVTGTVEVANVTKFKTVTNIPAPTNPQNPPQNPPQTGDFTALWVVLAVSAVAGAAVFTKKKAVR